MSILPWRQRKQFFYFGIFALAVLAIVAGIAWYFWPVPTCSDGKQNGKEEGIDCGGSCIPCLKEVKDISVLWKRFFKNKEGFYDVAALIENPNLFGGMPSIGYTFKLYDADNILIATREGDIFINPNQRQIIFESNIAVGSRIPRYTYFKFKGEENWKYINQEKSFLSVVSKNFINFPFPRLTAEIRNDSLFDIKNVFVAAVLYDDSGNAIGVSSTKIDSIKSESNQSASFTWPQPFDKEPASIEVIPTTNLNISSQSK